MSDYGCSMEADDLLALKNAEIASLREALAEERIRRESAEREADEAYQQMMSVTRANARLRQQIESWAQEADARAEHDKQLQRQGFEL